MFKLYLGRWRYGGGPPISVQFSTNNARTDLSPKLQVWAIVVTRHEGENASVEQEDVKVDPKQSNNNLSGLNNEANDHTLANGVGQRNQQRPHRRLIEA
jgi:hypothetical protein